MTVELKTPEPREPSDTQVILGPGHTFGSITDKISAIVQTRSGLVVLMDADLQDPPELIFDMLARYREGYAVVYAQRAKRTGETLFKRWSAWLFYRLMAALVYSDLPADTGDYRLVSRRCSVRAANRKHDASCPVQHAYRRRRD